MLTAIAIIIKSIRTQLILIKKIEVLKIVIQSKERENIFTFFEIDLWI